MRQIHRMGTWNVRGLLQPGKLEILEKELARCKLDICGISETHWKNNGHFLTETHAIYFSGNDNNSRNGVAFLIPKHLRNCVVEYEPQKMTSWMNVDSGSETSDQLWDRAKNVLMAAVKESDVSVHKRKRQHWMSEGTLKLVEERRSLKASGADTKTLNAKSARIQEACRRDQNAQLQSVCAEVERHANKHESRDLHQKIGTITKSLSSKTWAINDSSGETVTDIEAIAEIWREYCQSLFQDPQSQCYAPTEPKNEEIEPDILLDEIRTAIKHLKNGKATGSDAIPIETIKASGEYGVHIFHTLCQKIWQTGCWPKEWAHTIFVPLHKKGSTKTCSNYRLIALISHASKILLHVLNERLKSYLSKEIAPEQAGFVKGKGT
ncbi:hypothetical protein MSG28_015320 [Choristoneura fumiferana]|uniref:Uncharacterized protein n=1 Tax=Choristoneura fumiferana TaxID=7141 RepID=A0ACC0KA19_CHOFU|nr:hypothetical protein MSG28_015320 [Choristoneura fumiferana]